MDFGIQASSELPGPLKGLEAVWSSVQGLRGAKDYEASVDGAQDFYLYTGRGPSSTSLHLGHLLPLQTTRCLAAALKAPLVLQMTDDEKFITSKVASLADVKAYTRTNYEQMEHIFKGLPKVWQINSSDMGRLYPHILTLSQAFTASTLRATFGIEGEHNPLRYFFPLAQMALAFPEVMAAIDPSFRGRRCLIVAAPDQDPFFRLARDAAVKLGWTPPVILYLGTLPGLDSTADLPTKMSSSSPESCIFLTDDEATIRAKLRTAWSCGGATMAEHRTPPLEGWPVHLDPTCMIGLLFGSEEEKAAVQEFGNGKMGSAGLKKKIVAFLTSYLTSTDSE